MSRCIRKTSIYIFIYMYTNSQAQNRRNWATPATTITTPTSSASRHLGSAPLSFPYQTSPNRSLFTTKLHTNSKFRYSGPLTHHFNIWSHLYHASTLKNHYEIRGSEGNSDPITPSNPKPITFTIIEHCAALTRMRSLKKVSSHKWFGKGRAESPTHFIFL